MPEATYEIVAAGGCGLLPSRDDGKLLVTGSDAAGMLDGQLSNDVAALDVGAGCRAALLTGKGRMLADVRVLRREDGYLLLTERSSLQTLYDRLRAGGLGWSAEIGKLTLKVARIELIGDRSDAVAAAAGFSVPGPALHDCTTESVRTEDGLELLVDTSDESHVRTRLIAAGAESVGVSVAEIIRVEAGRPRWGHELDEQAMPEEAGIVDQLVSFTKGCYVGQETVARLHWKGKPNRHLRKLTLASVPAQGTPIFAVDDPGRQLGAIGSAVNSPSSGPIALAMLRREVGPGDSVRVGDLVATIAG